MVLHRFEEAYFKAFDNSYQDMMIDEVIENHRAENLAISIFPYDSP